MRLENIVWDARDPHLLGRFWAAAVGAELITDEPDLVEARMQLSDDVFLDLCSPHVTSPSASPARLHVALSSGAEHGGVLDDPEGNADPDRDGAFWAEITGWVASEGAPGVTTLRHPSSVGPLLGLRYESGPKRNKNRLADLRQVARRPIASDVPPTAGGVAVSEKSRSNGTPRVSATCRTAKRYRSSADATRNSSRPA